jgi:hypothetical protein
MASQGALLKEQFMADDLKKNPNEQSGTGQKSGQDYDQRNQGQQYNVPKKNPQDQDDEQDDQQQGGQRRAS